MTNMKDFVAVQLGEHTPTKVSTPVSFRCSDEVIIKMDLLTKHLSFSTRSKLLSELVPIALNDAISNLPEFMIADFAEEYEQILADHYEHLEENR